MCARATDPPAQPITLSDSRKGGDPLDPANLASAHRCCNCRDGQLLLRHAGNNDPFSAPPARHYTTVSGPRAQRPRRLASRNW